MKKMVFKIQGLDCAEEAAALRRAVGPVVGGAESLSCDILHGTMTVFLAEDTGSTEAIVQAVRQTGMQASLWSDASPVAGASPEEGGWQRWGRPLLCLVSVLCLVSGMLWHGFGQGNWLVALTGGAPQIALTLPLVSRLLYLGAIVSSAWLVLPKALYAARTLRPDMHLLMLVAVLGAIALDEWSEAATVAFLFALALLLESWSVGRARLAIRALMDLAPPTARCVCADDGSVEERRVEMVPVGTTVLVRPGEKIPLDGMVTRGTTTVNQAPITGEA